MTNKKKAAPAPESSSTEHVVLSLPAPTYKGQGSVSSLLQSQVNSTVAKEFLFSDDAEAVALRDRQVAVAVQEDAHACRIAEACADQRAQLASRKQVASAKAVLKLSAEDKALIRKAAEVKQAEMTAPKAATDTAGIDATDGEAAEQLPA